MIIIAIMLVWILGGVFFAICLDINSDNDTTIASIVYGGMLGIVIMFIGFIGCLNVSNKVVLKKRGDK